MKQSEKIIERLKQEGQLLEIPESVRPEQVKQTLELYGKRKQDGKVFRKIEKAMAAAACFLVLVGGSVLGMKQGWFGVFENTPYLEQDTKEVENTTALELHSQEKKDENILEFSPGMEPTEGSYETIYAAMLPVWEERGLLDQNEETVAGAAGTDAVVKETAAEESLRAENSQMKMTSDLLSADAAGNLAYGTTNVQTEGIDEGDLVKNDGRYLYQSMIVQREDGQEQAIQIVDTRDGLKEVGRVTGFQSIREFYVWEDLLIIIENKYMEHKAEAAPLAGSMAICDVYYFGNEYHEITVIDISARENPRRLKTFTLQGSYQSSRIFDGYFYGFSRYYASPGEGEQDYDAYVPKVDGNRLAVSQILLPEKGTGTSYLVLVSLDLRNPTEFYRTAAIVSDGSLFYVSSENIYVTAPMPLKDQEGWSSDRTSILRFAYDKGRFILQAEGEVKGRLNDSFSLDEYQGHLRVVSTVSEYLTEKLVDDRTGEKIGYTWRENRQTNSLYVLDKGLHVIGCIEGLAQDEQIYSARFLGNMGYFVTFRQVDPLFAVDLSDPERPAVLSELKISGFSEYLHFYGQGRLLGIGMEADPETGRQQGMKLSMFDISDPSHVTEIAKLPLKGYNYSEALYDHRAVLISAQANLFGFAAEGSERGAYCKEYLLFSYEDENFVQKMKLSCKSEDGGYYTCRGTFIGEVFYLLNQDGSVTSYSLKTGEILEKI